MPSISDAQLEKLLTKLLVINALSFEFSMKISDRVPRDLTLGGLTLLSTDGKSD